MRGLKCPQFLTMVKLVLWASFADNIVDGQTYKFSNLRLKSKNGKVSLGTTHPGCSIESCDPFPNLEPPKELPSTIKTEQLEVHGVSKVASYNVCPTCTKKVLIISQENMVKCQTGGTTVHKSKCEGKHQEEGKHQTEFHIISSEHITSSGNIQCNKRFK